MTDIKVEYILRETLGKYPVVENHIDHYVEGWKDAVEYIADKLGLDLDEPSD